MTDNYVSGKEASKILGVHQRTLHTWDKKGLIKTIRSGGGDKRFYNVEEYLKDKTKINEVFEGEEVEEDARLKICYCRVSTHSQKDDLGRQIDVMKKLYPKHIFITDIASGINFKRKGLLRIIDLSIEGKIEELVIAYKDRLTRFGYEMIEHFVEKYSKGKIIVLNEKKDLDPEEELVGDVLQILNVFTAKMNGLRKYKNK